MARGLPLKVEGSTTGVPSAGASLLESALGAALCACVGGSGREEAVLALRLAESAMTDACGARAAALLPPWDAVEPLEGVAVEATPIRQVAVFRGAQLLLVQAYPVETMSLNFAVRVDHPLLEQAASKVRQCG